MIKTRKIGKIFVYHGQKYQCVKGYGCKNCDFSVKREGVVITCSVELSDSGFCSEVFRSDGENVIFKLV